MGLIEFFGDLFRSGLRSILSFVVLVCQQLIEVFKLFFVSLPLGILRGVVGVLYVFALVATFWIPVYAALLGVAGATTSVETYVEKQEILGVHVSESIAQYGPVISPVICLFVMVFGIVAFRLVFNLQDSKYFGGCKVTPSRYQDRG